MLFTKSQSVLCSLGINRNEFVANLNLKGHQFFLLTVYCVLSHDLFSVYLREYLKFRNEIRG